MPYVCVCVSSLQCLCYVCSSGCGYTVNTCRRSKSAVPCAYSLNRFNGLSGESPRKNAWYPLQSAISFLYALQTKKRRPIPISHAPPIKGSAIFFSLFCVCVFFSFSSGFFLFFHLQVGMLLAFYFPALTPSLFHRREANTNEKERESSITGEHDGVFTSETL